MAGAAAVQVHRRAQAFLDLFDFLEVVLALVEERQLVRRQAGERRAGVDAIAHTRVARDEVDRGNVLRLDKQEARGGREHQRH
jgi:Tfp pilus assembly ATPase PilU